MSWTEAGWVLIVKCVLGEVVVLLGLRGGVVGDVLWVGVLEPGVRLRGHDWAGVEGVVVGVVVGLSGTPGMRLR